MSYESHFVSSPEELKTLLSKFESSRVYTYRETAEAIKIDPWKEEKEQGQGAGDRAICYDLGHLDSYAPGNDLDCPEFFLENKDVLNATGLNGAFHFAAAGARALDECRRSVNAKLFEQLLQAENQRERVFAFLDECNLINGAELPKNKFDTLPSEIRNDMIEMLTASKSIHPDCKWVSIHGHRGNVLIFSVDLIDEFLYWTQTVTRGAAKFKLSKEGRSILYAMRDKFSPDGFNINTAGEVLDERNFVALSEILTHHSAAD